jgi:Asp/Glu/hydantoin racemase
MRIMFLNQSPRNPRGDATHERTQALLRSYASPGTEVDLLYPEDFPGAHIMQAMGSQNTLTGLHHAMETPALIRKIVWAQDNGYDAVIQSNTFDPGVETGRLAVRIPVIGVLKASIHVAATIADRIGVTVPLPGHVPYTRRILRSYGMEHFATDIRAVGVYGEDSPERRQQLRDAALQTMHDVVRETGAECILPLGGALIPYMVDPKELEAEVGVPVLNTKIIGIHTAEMCVRFGMPHSERTYPTAKLRYEDFTATAN